MFGHLNLFISIKQTNGFFGSSGISGYVPHAYTQIARRFHAETCKQCQEERISLHEYYKIDWTFHVKGLWYYIQDSNLPVLTLIGSPNFGNHRNLFYIMMNFCILSLYLKNSDQMNVENNFYLYITKACY